SFDYNLNGQLSRVSNEHSQIDFYRNQIGQLIREHQHYKLPDLNPMTAVLRYDYDELGNLIKTIRPDGHEVAHLSYGSGHIYGIALNQKDMIGFKRDDLHRETERYLANGLIQRNQYNDVGLLISQQIQPEQETQSPLDPSQQTKALHQAQRHYHYDKNYLLTQVDDSRLGKLNYHYDPIGRLIKSQSAQQSESFSFDPAGNLIDPIATQASQVKDNLIREYQGKRYSYDAQGNVIETTQGNKTLKLTWDNLNRLIQSDHNGRITYYGYDVFGRRLYKKSQDAKGRETLTLFGWDGDLMVWESKTVTDHKDLNSQQYNKDNSENKQDYTKHYIYEPNSFVPALQAGYSQFIKLIETPDYSRFKTEPYSIYKDPVWKTETRKQRAELEGVAFYHCDQVGTPQSLSNELGECVWSIRQSTWGRAEEISQSNPDNPFEHTEIRFQGQYYDEETGLHYNRYRYYEPYSARYISKDPIGLQGGLNNSTYVSDPNQWVDPLGLSDKKVYPDPAKLRAENIALQQEEFDRLKSQNTYTKVNNGLSKIATTSKNKIISNTSTAIVVGNQIINAGKSAYNRMKGSLTLSVLMCQSLGGCRRPDYLVCSGSLANVTGAVTINLYNGQSYIGKGLDSAPFIKGKKYAGIDNSSGNIKKMSEALGGSCSLGYIFNKTKGLSVTDATDSFLDGLAGSAGVTLSNIRVGVSNPANEDWFNLLTPKAIEIGLSSEKVGWDGGISINEKSINLNKKYQQLSD
ncbi:RHS repeat protein, partial [Acinetobacter sp. 187]|uniref:RHS repeat-associated core domain-containing protein n=1 Tax=Acinetobacter lanii TaxID=2715163 RepID=UPI0018C88FB9